MLKFDIEGFNLFGYEFNLSFRSNCTPYKKFKVKVPKLAYKLHTVQNNVSYFLKGDLKTHTITLDNKITKLKIIRTTSDRNDKGNSIVILKAYY